MQHLHHDAGPDSAIPIPISFLATNITGTQSIPVEVDGKLTVRAVADSIASRMMLPDDVPWALRDDSSAYLDDDASIGSQIGPDSNITITPKTHLGGGVGLAGGVGSSAGVGSKAR